MLIYLTLPLPSHPLFYPPALPLRGHPLTPHCPPRLTRTLGLMRVLEGRYKEDCFFREVIDFGLFVSLHVMYNIMPLKKSH